MLRFILAVITSRFNVAGKNPFLALILLERSYELIKGRIPWSKRERRAIINSVRSTRIEWPARRIATRKSQGVTIFVPATCKDFEILPEVVLKARESVSQFAEVDILIAVPTADLEQAQSLLLKTNINVVDEQSLLNKSLLIEKFSATKRPEWVYQQFLKIAAIEKARTPYVIVIDADTLLLRRRVWVDKRGRHILTPTLEFELEYEEMANSLNLKLKSGDEMSFVPHHMFYSKEYFFRMWEFLGVSSLLDFIDLLVEKSNKAAKPFSVDYELYGRYMFLHCPDQINILRWANLPLPRSFYSRFEKSKLSKFLLSRIFNSVSFHSWTSI